MLTIKDVKYYIKEIKNSRHDDEIAHEFEDSLYYDVLRSISTGECEDPKECARLAVTTRNISFDRWCA